MEEALLGILAARTGGRPAAEAYLEGLKKAERYQRDVWF